MILQEKIDRAMEWLKNKNKNEYGSSTSELGDYDPKAEWLAEESNKIHLEKGDFLAMLLSAAIIFGPILLILFLILVFVL